MKIKIKSWRYIKKTIDKHGVHCWGGGFFSQSQRKDCGKIFEALPPEKGAGVLYKSGDMEWKLHPDWYDLQK